MNPAKMWILNGVLICMLITKTWSYWTGEPPEEKGIAAMLQEAATEMLPPLALKALGYPYSTLTEKGLYNFYSYFIPWDEWLHNPYQLESFPPYSAAHESIKDLPKAVNQSINATVFSYKIPDAASYTPDFRLPEEHLFSKYKASAFKEHGRYFRITPRTFLANWNGGLPDEHPFVLQCYSVCVFKRFTPLSMGANLTPKHVLTTAMATDVVLRRYRHKLTLENILGLWYETNHNARTNSVIYATPARIHYHPRWTPPEFSNRSHPLPNSYDLAVWTLTRQMFGPKAELGLFASWGASLFPEIFTQERRAPLCLRPNVIRYISMFHQVIEGDDFGPPVLDEDLLTIFVGTLMVQADLGRKAFPWFKYAVKTRRGKRQPCPKTEWGWFHCIEHVDTYPKLGVDIGAPLHITYETKRWRSDGLAGINSFSMKLRSGHPVSYFTVLDRHSVQNFLYASYCGRLPYQFLDNRFEDTQWYAPKLREFANNMLIDETRAHYLGDKHDLYYPIWWR